MSKLEPTRTCSNPTATEILRRLLDEHDEYYKTSGNKTWWGRPIDRQTGKPINVFHYQAQPMGEDRLLIELQLATPEQAIAATLGTGTCHIVKTWSDSDYVDGWRYRCSECGCFIPVNERDPETSDVISAANYCPNCGRRCVG